MVLLFILMIYIYKYIYLFESYCHNFEILYLTEKL